MRFYTQQHKHYCGIDLHARMMYLCVMDAAGAVLLSRNIECSPRAFLAAVKGFRDDLVVAVECMFTWYWLADLCARMRPAAKSAGPSIGVGCRTRFCQARVENQVGHTNAADRA